MTAQDVQTFFDSVVPYALQRGDIAGSVIVVVKDGQPLFAQGYGYADVANGKPVVADQTLFRPGSISKTFAWTAVMQLVGAGKIDLDKDVNSYLDFTIPEKFGKPITMRDLMTHTAGFEESVGDEFMKSTDQLFPYGDYVKKHLPARIFPPGKLVAYSNYGATLAGYIVERVSGQPFNEYVAEHIFKPLGMDHSTFEQPLPAPLAANMSVGYHSASDKKTIPFEAIEVGPAGSLSATGADMAHFMIAQLGGGQYNGATMLSPAMIELMHSPQSTMAPGLNGFDLGFYQENRNGQRIIGHAGDTAAFHSDLHLLLDQHVGVFMSFNSPGKQAEVGRLRTALFRSFLDRYYPYAPPHEETVANPKPDAARVAGAYEVTRRIESTFSVLQALTQSSVIAQPDGTIKIEALKDLSGTPKTWREVGPLVYREVGGQAHTKFITDKDGRIQYWISDDFLPVELFQPVHGLRSIGMLKSLGVLFLVTLVLTVVIWFGGWVVRRRFHAPLVMTRGQRRLRLASRLGAVLLLVMVCSWLLMISSGIEASNHTIGLLLTALYILGVLTALGAIAMLIHAVLRVLRGPGGWLARLGEVFIGLSALYGLWAICAYGLANFNYTF
ncbi:serine hydrolase domain-containing protein [Dyella amyloliquefaciens]|uniref:serine hydrolase domain-containing protein n=1 Tax=Dyella amyloliquefaciens TaxID=1770545 RepID=UPI0013EEA2D9|nr:serine hydrolase domain-containing protein [Dyella amyloliquefaciens]